MFRKMLLASFALLIALSVSFAQEKEKTITIKGKLLREGLEGGVWTLEFDGKKYDLHGDLKGFKIGDEVEITGKISQNQMCIHQLGIVFEVETIKKAGQPAEEKIEWKFDAKDKVEKFLAGGKEKYGIFKLDKELESAYSKKYFAKQRFFLALAEVTVVKGPGKLPKIFAVDTDGNVSELSDATKIKPNTPAKNSDEALELAFAYLQIAIYLAPISPNQKVDPDVMVSLDKKDFAIAEEKEGWKITGTGKNKFASIASFEILLDKQGSLKSIASKWTEYKGPFYE